MKIAILGYGNLGKALEKAVRADENAELVGIFSRRKLDHPLYFPAQTLPQQRQIDCVAVALGSYADTVETVLSIAGKFNTVDSYDNHALLVKYKSALAQKAESGKKTSIIAAGWDPGLLSAVRALLSICNDSSVATFWGKGVSQGHSNALRTIDGVADAVQFTVPKEEYLEKAKNGQTAECADYTLTHKRLCYVAADGDREKIAQEIRSMPDYFAPYETEICFVSPEKIAELKRDMAHKGQVFGHSPTSDFYCCLQTKSNPELTAEIMLAYCKAAVNMEKSGKIGAFDCLDVPLRYVAPDSML